MNVNIVLICTLVNVTLSQQVCDNLPTWVHTVDTCPSDEEAWRNASNILKCNREGVKDYHCLPTQYLNCLVEFCYGIDSTYFGEGNCIVLWVDGDGGATINNKKCDDLFPQGSCPGQGFISSEIHNYQDCLKINKEMGCYLADAKCRASVLPPTTDMKNNSQTDLYSRYQTSITTTSTSKKGLTYNEQWTITEKEIPPYIFSTLLVIPLSIPVLVMVLYCCQRNTRETEEPEQGREKEPMLPTEDQDQLDSRIGNEHHSNDVIAMTSRIENILCLKTILEEFQVTEQEIVNEYGITVNEDFSEPTYYFGGSNRERNRECIRTKFLPDTYLIKEHNVDSYVEDGFCCWIFDITENKANIECKIKEVEKKFSNRAQVDNMLFVVTEKSKDTRRWTTLPDNIYETSCSVFLEQMRRYMQKLLSRMQQHTRIARLEDVLRQLINKISACIGEPTERRPPPDLKFEGEAAEAIKLPCYRGSGRTSNGHRIYVDKYSTEQQRDRLLSTIQACNPNIVIQLTIVSETKLHYAQGDSLFFSPHSENNCTLGGVMINKLTKEGPTKLYGITASHALICSPEVYAKENGDNIPIGKRVLLTSTSQPPTANGIGLIEIYQDINAKITLGITDDKMNKLKCKIRRSSLKDCINCVVKKKGGRSQWTTGSITSTWEKGDGQEYFFVEGFRDEFAMPGDSGAIVFRIADDLTTFEVLGIVVGKVSMSHDEDKFKNESTLCLSIKEHILLLKKHNLELVFDEDDDFHLHFSQEEFTKLTKNLFIKTDVQCT